jgi:hypothetical protein
MGNRHGHKQLRIAIRARMSQTGESFQQARAQILKQRGHLAKPWPTPEVSLIHADLLPIRYFGAPAALATFEIAGRLSVLVISSSSGLGPFPRNPLIALGPPRLVH